MASSLWDNNYLYPQDCFYPICRTVATWVPAELCLPNLQNCGFTSNYRTGATLSAEQWLYYLHECGWPMYRTAVTQIFRIVAIQIFALLWSPFCRPVATLWSQEGKDDYQYDIRFPLHGEIITCRIMPRVNTFLFSSSS